MGFVLPSGGGGVQGQFVRFQDLQGGRGQGGCWGWMWEFAEALLGVKGEVVTLESSNPYFF